jgi:membrane-bound serine protease (ClpP class)
MILRMFLRMTLGVVFGVLGAVVAHAASSAPTVIVAEVQGSIDPGTASYVESAIRVAEAERAGLLLIELDTPGGLVTSVRAMAQAIDRSDVPVAVYVTPAGASATSAGALLSLASHVSAMAPGTNIGAAHPVDSSGKDLCGSMQEKVVNDTADFARGLEEARVRNRSLA